VRVAGVGRGLIDEVACTNIQSHFYAANCWYRMAWMSL
jgi:hypothetical protein